MKPFRIIFLFLITLLPLSAFSQSVEMADKFREEGKIYVVVTIALIILSGIFIYLFMLDRKVKNIEDQLKK